MSSFFFLPFLYFYSLANSSLTHLVIHPFTRSFICQTDIRWLPHLKFFLLKMQKYMTSSLCLKDWIQFSKNRHRCLRLKLVSWFLLRLNERGFEMQIGQYVPSMKNCSLCYMGIMSSWIVQSLIPGRRWFETLPQAEV